MNVLIVSATQFEVLPLQTYLVDHFKTKDNKSFSKDGLTIHLLITGIGYLNTSLYVGRIMQANSYDYVLNMGIAGAFNKNLSLCEVVEIQKDTFSDIGVEEANGQFTDWFEMGFMNQNEAPFTDGWIINKTSGSLKEVSCITSNLVHGYPASIDKIYQKYSADIQTMESAAVLFICMIDDVPCTLLRSISNYVEKRNKEHWDIPGAIESLNKVAIELVQSFQL